MSIVSSLRQNILKKKALKHSKTILKVKKSTISKSNTKFQTHDVIIIMKVIELVLSLVVKYLKKKVKELEGIVTELANKNLQNLDNARERFNSKKLELCFQFKMSVIPYAEFFDNIRFQNLINYGTQLSKYKVQCSANKTSDPCKILTFQIMKHQESEQDLAFTKSNILECEDRFCGLKDRIGEDFYFQGRALGIMNFKTNFNPESGLDKFIQGLDTFNNVIVGTVDDAATNVDNAFNNAKDYFKNNMADQLSLNVEEQTKLFTENNSEITRLLDGGSYDSGGGEGWGNFFTNIDNTREVYTSLPVQTPGQLKKAIADIKDDIELMKKSKVLGILNLIQRGIPYIVLIVSFVYRLAGNEFTVLSSTKGRNGFIPVHWLQTDTLAGLIQSIFKLISNLVLISKTKKEIKNESDTTKKNDLKYKLSNLEDERWSIIKEIAGLVFKMLATFLVMTLLKQITKGIIKASIDQGKNHLEHFSNFIFNINIAIQSLKIFKNILMIISLSIKIYKLKQLISNMQLEAQYEVKITDNYVKTLHIQNIYVSLKFNIFLISALQTHLKNHKILTYLKNNETHKALAEIDEDASMEEMEEIPNERDPIEQETTKPVVAGTYITNAIIGFNVDTSKDFEAMMIIFCQISFDYCYTNLGNLFTRIEAANTIQKIVTNVEKFKSEKIQPRLIYTSTFGPVISPIYIHRYSQLKDEIEYIYEHFDYKLFKPKNSQNVGSGNYVLYKRNFFSNSYVQKVVIKNDFDYPFGNYETNNHIFQIKSDLSEDGKYEVSYYKIFADTLSTTRKTVNYIFFVFNKMTDKVSLGNINTFNFQEIRKNENSSIDINGLISLAEIDEITSGDLEINGKAINYGNLEWKTGYTFKNYYENRIKSDYEKLYNRFDVDMSKKVGCLTLESYGLTYDKFTGAKLIYKLFYCKDDNKTDGYMYGSSLKIPGLYLNFEVGDRGRAESLNEHKYNISGQSKLTATGNDSLNLISEDVFNSYIDKLKESNCKFAKSMTDLKANDSEYKLCFPDPKLYVYRYFIGSADKTGLEIYDKLFGTKFKKPDGTVDTLTNQNYADTEMMAIFNNQIQTKGQLENYFYSNFTTIEDFKVRFLSSLIKVCEGYGYSVSNLKDYRNIGILWASDDKPNTGPLYAEKFLYAGDEKCIDSAMLYYKLHFLLTLKKSSWANKIAFKALGGKEDGSNKSYYYELVELTQENEQSESDMNVKGDLVSSAIERQLDANADFHAFDRKQVKYNGLRDAPIYTFIRFEIVVKSKINFGMLNTQGITNLIENCFIPYWPRTVRDFPTDKYMTLDANNSPDFEPTGNFYFSLFYNKSWGTWDDTSMSYRLWVQFDYFMISKWFLVNNSLDGKRNSCSNDKKSKEKLSLKRLMK